MLSIFKNKNGSEKSVQMNAKPLTPEMSEALSQGTKIYLPANAEEKAKKSLLLAARNSIEYMLLVFAVFLIIFCAVVILLKNNLNETGSLFIFGGSKAYVQNISVIMLIICLPSMPGCIKMLEEYIKVSGIIKDGGYECMELSVDDSYEKENSEDVDYYLKTGEAVISTVYEIYKDASRSGRIIVFVIDTGNNKYFFHESGNDIYDY